MFLIHTSAEHAETVARAVVAACRLDGWQTPVQPKLLHTLFNRLLGQDFDFDKIEAVSSAEVAQHDWVHVLADYGATPMGEIEASGFLNATTRTPGGMLGFIGGLALFESGLMPASLVVSTQPGHSLSAPGAIERLAEVVATGAACNTDLLLDVDFFRIAAEPLEHVRTRFNVQPKSPKIAAFDPYGALKLAPHV